MSSLNVAVTHKKEWSAIAKSKLFIFCPLINYIQLCVPCLARKRERWERERNISLQQVFLTLNQHCQVQWDRTNILCQTNIYIFSQIHANIWFLWTHRQENVPGVLPNFPILFWIAFQIFRSERFWSVQTIPFFYNIHVNRHSLIPAFLTVDLFLTESHLECCLLLKRI